MPWIVIRTLGTLVDTVYCETCAEWFPFKKDPTAAERAGIVIPPELPYDAPPPF